MFRKSILMGLVVVLVVGIAAVALAAPNKSFVSPLSQLSLTDEQYSKLREVDGEHFKEMQTLRNKMMEKTQEFRNAYLQKDPDEAVIEKLEKEISLIEEEMHQLHQDKFDDMSAVFTEEQLEELKASRGAAFGEGRGFRCKGSGMGMGMNFGRRQGSCGLGLGAGNGWIDR